VGEEVGRKGGLRGACLSREPRGGKTRKKANQVKIVEKRPVDRSVVKELPSRREWSAPKGGRGKRRD
jgi:hypothetical protein